MITYANRYIFKGYRNNPYFPYTNPYKYANRWSHVTMQRAAHIYRAWATCDQSECYTSSQVTNARNVTVQANTNPRWRKMWTSA